MMLHWLFLELSSGDGTTMSEPFVFEIGDSTAKLTI